MTDKEMTIEEQARLFEDLTDRAGGLRRGL
jgi:hypothetical protein